eukprot:366337-Chlamydomonas_euryale.AAC.19
MGQASAKKRVSLLSVPSTMCAAACTPSVQNPPLQAWHVLYIVAYVPPQTPFSHQASALLGPALSPARAVAESSVAPSPWPSLSSSSDARFVRMWRRRLDIVSRPSPRVGGRVLGALTALWALWASRHRWRGGAATSAPTESRLRSRASTRIEKTIAVQPRPAVNAADV